MEGEALGAMKVLCPSIEECLGLEAGVGGVGQPGMGERIGYFQRGN